MTSFIFNCNSRILFSQFYDFGVYKDYIFEDSIMTIKKIKPCGWIIFDDIHDNEVNTYFKTEMKNSQLFIQCNN